MNDLLIHLFNARMSLDNTLVCLSNAGRLPVSILALAAICGTDEADLARKLGADSRVSLERIGDMIFVSKVEIVFPRPSLEAIRDDVLRIHSFPKRSESAVQRAARTCPHISKERCNIENCPNLHFSPLIRVGITEPSMGLCSYLNHCKNPKCKFVHFEFADESVPDAPPEGSQWINCDVRLLPLNVFHSLVSAVLIDPPWDIHMDLPYGTMTDDEMRNLPVSEIHSDSSGGFVFIWATTRTVEVARDCLRIWGYTRVDEIVWVKTNQIGGTVRSGRTGHWLNHNKEHCLIGMKGDVSYSCVGGYRQDCDVIVAPVRQNSRKPDELYDIIERIVRKDRLCLELFGRGHNRRPGWITVGNQLEGTWITDPELCDRSIYMSLPSSSGGSVLIRPSAPSPKEQLTLVPFTSPMSSEDSWPSPDLSAIHSPETSKSNRSNRVSVLHIVGELLDSALLTSDDVSELIEIIMKGEKEVAAVSDLIEARPCMRGKAQFLKLFLRPSTKREESRGFTTPNPTYHEWQVSGLYHPPTPFVDIPSPLVRSASPPLRFPTAIRPAPVKLSCIKEDLVRMSSTESSEEPKYSPESFKSTNVGSSIDASTVSPPNGPTRESTSSTATPDKMCSRTGLVQCVGDPQP